MVRWTVLGFGRRTHFQVPTLIYNLGKIVEKIRVARKSPAVKGLVDNSNVEISSILVDQKSHLDFRLFLQGPAKTVQMLPTH
jgi:hypothetical protein